MNIKKKGLKMIEFTAKGWRIYYRIQELLETEYLDKFEEKSDGGVRKTSTLPPELNKKTKELTIHLINSVEDKNINSAELFKKVEIQVKKKPLSYLDLNKDDIGDLIALPFNERAYHIMLNKLHKDLRPYIYKKVLSNNYYLVFDKNSGLIVGGFTTTKVGAINGLFSLVKGIGHKISELCLTYAIRNADIDITYLRIFCIGNKLRKLYEEFGFEIRDVIKWDDNLAPENWNYDRFGKPDLYIMIKEIK